jgi:hypothetical protein
VHQWTGEIAVMWLVFSMVRAMPSAQQQNYKHSYNNMCFLWDPCVTSCVGQLAHPRLHNLPPPFPFFLGIFWRVLRECSPVSGVMKTFILAYKIYLVLFGLEYSGVQVKYATSGILFWFVWLITIVNTTMRCYWYFCFIGMRLLFLSCPVSFTCSY